MKFLCYKRLQWKLPDPFPLLRNGVWPHKTSFKHALHQPSTQHRICSSAIKLIFQVFPTATPTQMKNFQTYLIHKYIIKQSHAFKWVTKFEVTPYFPGFFSHTYCTFPSSPNRPQHCPIEVKNQHLALSLGFLSEILTKRSGRLPQEASSGSDVWQRSVPGKPKSGED